MHTSTEVCATYLVTGTFGWRLLGELRVPTLATRQLMSWLGAQRLPRTCVFASLPQYPWEKLYGSTKNRTSLISSAISARLRDPPLFWTTLWQFITSQAFPSGHSVQVLEVLHSLQMCTTLCLSNRATHSRGWKTESRFGCLWFDASCCFPSTGFDSNIRALAKAQR